MRKKLISAAILFLFLCGVNAASQYDSNFISITHFEKIGHSDEEVLSIKNDSDEDISSVSIRLFYILENGAEIDFQEINLNEVIISGESKQFKINSFDKDKDFAYKYGKTTSKNLFILFDIEYEVLEYRIKQKEQRQQNYLETNSFPDGKHNEDSHIPTTTSNNNSEVNLIYPNADTQKQKNYPLVYTTGTVNMRPSPTTKSNIIKKLSLGTPLYLISSVPINGFYNIIDVRTEAKGFVHQSYLSSEKHTQHIENLSSASPAKPAQKNYSVATSNNTTKKTSVSASKKTTNTNRATGKTVYICTGPRAEKYHSTATCPGMNRCSASIIGVSESEAWREGRTKCARCY